jgi:FMN-dependent NADH-azoreductase
VTRILVINSSVSGDASASRTLVAEAVERLVEANPGAVVTERDLDAAPVPHLTSATVGGVRAVAATEAERAAQALSDELIAELFAADVIVIGAPMYNFSIPTTLRAWFDHVLRARVTFAYSDAGPEGLVKGKKVIVIESRGGLYSEGPAQMMDFQEPYLRALLGFIGLTDVEFVHAEKIGFGPEARDAALAGAKARIAKIAAAGELARAA